MKQRHLINTFFSWALFSGILISSASANSLPVPPGLQKNVDFWVQIYTRFNTHQGVIHDARYLDRIYEVLDLTQGSSSVKIRQAKMKWRTALLEAHKKQLKPETFTADERHVFELFRDIDDPNKLLAAAHRKRLRFQLGQRDRFQRGIAASAKYLPRMEAIFKKEGLPVELTRLPFVESSFNILARSKVGASGIWQFMPSTGRLFLRIDSAVDERNDPIRATEAAAKLLSLNYSSLNNWPLAVTAYNHGRKGLMRAVRKLGSEDLSDLVTSYKSRTFGFASSNFYSSLLAAIEAYQNRQLYFPAVIPDVEKPSFEVTLPSPILIPELVRYLKIDRAHLKELNPGIQPEVFKGQIPFPKLSILRIPHLPDDPTYGKLDPDASVRVFLAGIEQIPDLYKTSYSRKLSSGKRRRKEMTP